MNFQFTYDDARKLLDEATTPHDKAEAKEQMLIAAVRDRIVLVEEVQRLERRVAHLNIALYRAEERLEQQRVVDALTEILQPRMEESCRTA